MANTVGAVMRIASHRPHGSCVVVGGVLLCVLLTFVVALRHALRPAELRAASQVFACTGQSPPSSESRRLENRETTGDLFEGLATQKTFPPCVAQFADEYCTGITQAVLLQLPEFYGGDGGATADGVPPQPVFVQPFSIAAIVETFNHAASAQRILRRLRNYRDTVHVQKIIAIDDGSTDDSLAMFSEALAGDHEHVVLRMNNVHEVRAYNAAMRLADTDLVLLLQDDDLVPRSGAWLHDVAAAFATNTRLAVASANIGLMFCCEGGAPEFGDASSYNPAPTFPMPFELVPAPHTSRTGHAVPYMHVGCAALAPLVVRRAFLEQAYAQFDVRFSPTPGTPGILLDCDMSYAAWQAGWDVAVVPGLFMRGVEGHGTMSSTAASSMRETAVQRNNAFLFGEKYPDVCALERRGFDSLARLHRKGTIRSRPAPPQAALDVVAAAGGDPAFARELAPSSAARDSPFLLGLEAIGQKCAQLDVVRRARDDFGLALRAVVPRATCAESDAARVVTCESQRLRNIAQRIALSD